MRTPKNGILFAGVRLKNSVKTEKDRSFQRECFSSECTFKYIINKYKCKIFVKGIDKK